MPLYVDICLFYAAKN